jgi:hydroxymethylpyrimidine pyrophosphatase-like HAD family hydrolase
MHFLAFATDYDGTLAHHGVVAPSTLEVLKRVKATGRKILLVTGREMDDLVRVFPETAMFDLVIAENGAVLFEPSTGLVKTLCEPPPPAFIEELRAKGVPMSVGRVICSTVEPHEHAVLDAIREQGLELQVIFNKGSAMVLPTGINKATGLVAACAHLGLSHHNVVGIGDAENDHVFITRCEIGVAVENALPALKGVADYVTEGRAGEGVERFLEEHLLEDCRRLAPRIARHAINLGADVDRPDHSVSVPVHHQRVLVAGQMPTARHALVSALTGSVMERDYQILVIDTEGPLTDVAQRAGLVVVRAQRGSSAAEEIASVFSRPGTSALLETSWLDGAARVTMVNEVIEAVRGMQHSRGAPHWILVHDARRVIPAVGPEYIQRLLSMDASIALSTAYPNDLNLQMLARVDRILAADDIAANNALAGIWKARHITPGRGVELRTGGDHHLSIVVDAEGNARTTRFHPAPIWK